MNSKIVAQNKKAAQSQNPTSIAIGQLIEEKILSRLRRGKHLTPRQVAWVRENISAIYQDQCEISRLSVWVALGSGLDIGLRTLD